MSEKVKRSLRNIFAKVKQATGDAIAKPQMEHLGEFAVDLIVKRTRLGYGVDRQFGVKRPLKPLSQRYKDYRARFKRLATSTTKNKSNLTLTGQLLESVKVIRAQDGKLSFGPTGNRIGDFFSNEQIALFQQKQGRTFNRLSELEYKQVLREYRRTFGDLLRKRRLLS